MRPAPGRRARVRGCWESGPGMTRRNHLFTSESVTEGHPDKIADQISDAILDAIMAKDPLGRVACETAVTTGLAFVIGEITTDTYVEMRDIIRDTIEQAGYDHPGFGFDAETDRKSVV